MKSLRHFFLLLLSLSGLSYSLSTRVLGAQAIKDLTLAGTTTNGSAQNNSGAHTFLSGASATFASGSTLTLNGALTGTPTGGTLNLSALTLTLPATVSGGTSSLQPLDSDLTAIAALTTTANGRSLLTLASVPSGALVGTSDLQTLTNKTFTTPILGAATATSITGATATDVTLQGGSSGALLALGQGASGSAAFSSTAQTGFISGSGGTLQLTQRSGAVGHGPAILLLSGAVGGEPVARISSGVTATNAANLVFETNNGQTNPSEKARLTSTGNLLIGTATDLGLGTKLQVNGSGHFQNNLYTTGTVNSLSTNPSTSTTTGSGIFGGGIGVAGSLYAGVSAVLTGSSANNRFVVANDTTGGTRALQVTNTSQTVEYFGIQSTSSLSKITSLGDFSFGTGGSGTTALTLSTTGVATFLGAINAGNTISTSGTFASGRGLSATTPSGYTVGLRLLQSSVSDWQIENIATTGLLAFSSSGIPAVTFTGAGAATFAGAINAGGANTAGIAKTGTGFAGFAEFSNATDFGVNTTYAFLSEPAGDTYINAKAGKVITLRNTNAARMTVGDTVVNIPITTSASSSTTGALTIGNGTAATNVAIGGGKINAGGTITSGSATSDGELIAYGGAGPWKALTLRYGSGTDAYYAGQVATLYSYAGNAYYANSGSYLTQTSGGAATTRFSPDGTFSITSDSGLTANVAFTPTVRLSVLPTRADFTGITTSGTSTTAAAILGKSMGLTENLFVGGTGNFVGDAIVTSAAQSVFRATATNNNGISGNVLTTGNGGSLQAWIVGSNLSGASGEFAIRDSTGTNNALTITKGTLAATFNGVTILKNYTVATLPAAASYTYGEAYVSDATQAAGTSLGSAPTGGGSVVRGVYSNGSAWLLR